MSGAVIRVAEPEKLSCIISHNIVLTQDGQPGRRSNRFATGRRPGADLTLVLRVIRYCHVSDK